MHNTRTKHCLCEHYIYFQCFVSSTDAARTLRTNDPLFIKVVVESREIFHVVCFQYITGMFHVYHPFMFVLPVISFPPSRKVARLSELSINDEILVAVGSSKQVF